MMALAQIQDETDEGGVLSHRFIPPDFDAIGIWLLSRLRARWTWMAERTAFGWLKGVMDSGDYMFLRNGGGVILADRTNDPLDPRPKVRVIFCVSQDGQLPVTVNLYADVKRWALGMGAKEIVLGEFTDIPRPMIQEVFGAPKIRTRNVAFWDMTSDS
jgi:hypothetical protein